MNLYFMVDGRPVPKERPRFAGGHTYTSKRTTDYEAQVLQAAMAALTPDERKMLPISSACHVTIHAYFPIPKSAKHKSKPDSIINGDPYTSTPDLDNLAKIVLDALNKKVFSDDRYVVHLNAWKSYSDKPRMVVLIEFPDVKYK